MLPLMVNVPVRLEVFEGATPRGSGAKGVLGGSGDLVSR